MTTAAERLREAVQRKRAEGRAPIPPPAPSRPRKRLDPSLWREYIDAAPPEEAGYHRSELELQIDEMLEHLTVIDAYNIWIKKMIPDPRGKTEGVKISCPIPGHVDKNPSAWINTEKETWFCGACQRGGDQLDIAAIGLGYDLDSYKEGTIYGEFRRRAAQELGLTIEYIPGVGYISYTPVTEEEFDTRTNNPSSGHSNGSGNGLNGHARVGESSGSYSYSSSGSDDLERRQGDVGAANERQEQRNAGLSGVSGNTAPVSDSNGERGDSLHSGAGSTGTGSPAPVRPGWK